MILVYGFPFEHNGVKGSEGKIEIKEECLDARSYLKGGVIYTPPKSKTKSREIPLFYGGDTMKKENEGDILLS
jgi:hypothetical protein